MSSPATILQEDLSNRRDPIPAQTNIPNYTFQDRESQSHMNIFSSNDTSEGKGYK